MAKAKLHFSCPLLLVCGFFFRFGFCSFLTTLSLSLVSLPASLPGVLSLSWFVCSVLGVPSSSFPGSSFLLVLILFPCLSLIHHSVWRFCLSSATFCGLSSPRCFGACLPSVYRLVCMDCSLLLWLCWVDRLTSPVIAFPWCPWFTFLFMSLLVVTSPFFFNALLTWSNLQFPTRRGSSLWAESVPS